MSDMLVKLYDIDYRYPGDKLAASGITIKRACVVDKREILRFVETAFPDEPAYVSECEYALFNNPVSCHIAVKDRAVIGFACYDATAKGFLGPMGVVASCRRNGVGTALLLKSLYSMRESGYAYAIIGWVAQTAKEFYQNTVHATIINDSPPGKSVYKNTIAQG